MRKNDRLPTYINGYDKAGGMYFSFLALLLILVTVLVSAVITGVTGGGDRMNELTRTDGYRIFSFFVTPTAILLLSFLFMKLVGPCDVRAFCKMPDKRSWLSAALIFFGMFFGLSSLNSLFISFLGKTTGYRYTEIAFPSLTPANYILTVLGVCLLPAIAEEIAFRGIVAKGLTFLPTWEACLAGGVLFSLFHMNPAQTPYQLCVGALFTFLALKSGSPVSSAAVHFLNNFLIVTFEFFAPGALDFVLPVKIVLAVLGIGAIVLGVFLSARRERERTEGSRLAFFWRAFVGIAICVVMWIAQLVVSRG